MIKNLKQIEVFIESSPQGSIFASRSWLDIVAPGRWEYVISEDKDVINGILPIVKTKTLMGTKLNMPTLTPALGVVLRPMDTKSLSSTSFYNKTLDDIISKLPRHLLFRQRFHPNFTNWMPFYWKGFNQYTRYTYILDNIKDHDMVWSGLRSNIRREIRKAKKSIKVIPSNDPEKLYQLFTNTLKNQNAGKIPEFMTVSKIVELINNKKNGTILIGLDEKGVSIGGILLLSDRNTTYYLAGGNLGQYKNTGVMSLLLWEGIKWASIKGDRFNFEGSMIKSIERYFKSFGGGLVSYYEISKLNLPMLNKIKI